ncbi:acetolactate synthase small subunit [Ktedonosporobacter rubrisoli]|uniref:Acetolactate synthase small subunit n=1 Tax=Ktedonosporobacter rubrisoli TaxID=2509675 RepID=A0A4P6K2K2_KTERU|nr:acetolactate synthase small subunit [Ktedonosporobacter rubrisoli]QBD82093.1 acetolactate synthase small subunit [Ktedonosporobacter rubrisoli]
MTGNSATVERAWHSDAPQGTEQTHTLVVLVEDRPGAVDRVVGLFRRRRASLQTLALGPSEQTGVMRFTAVVNDSEVGIDHVVEQLRKVVDVKQVVNLTDKQAVSRELALIKVNGTTASFNAIIELGCSFGARVVEATAETITLEATGSSEQIEQLVSQLQAYGIREIARSGKVALTRTTKNV